jgi:hypothetical protein
MNDDRDFLDDEFPLGDGTADTEAEASCPCCGATVTLVLDPGGGALQEYVEDCEVCCRPWAVRVSYHDDGSAEVWLRPLDE